MRRKAGSNPGFSISKGTKWQRQSFTLMVSICAPVVKMEEKRSDVNIATEMLMDAISGCADAFTLVTGDSDLAAPVQAIRYRLKKPIAVFNPHEATCLELKRFASFYKTLRKTSRRNVNFRIQQRLQMPDHN